MSVGKYIPVADSNLCHAFFFIGDDTKLNLFSKRSFMHPKGEVM
jgi:hypothetical protein